MIYSTNLHSKKNIKLFCFDIDNTLMYSNTNDELNRKFILPHITNDNQLVINGIPKKKKINSNYNSEGVIAAVHQLLSDPKTGLKYPKQTIEVLEKLLLNGHKVAITTVNKYPEVVDIVLQELCKNGLAVQFIKKINIISGFPLLGPKDKNGKNEHINEAMKLTGINNPNNIILIDDKLLNIRAAKKAGYNTILVPLGFNPNPKYLNEILDFSTNNFQNNLKNSELVNKLKKRSVKKIIKNEKNLSLWQRVTKKLTKIRTELFPQNIIYEIKSNDLNQTDITKKNKLKEKKLITQSLINKENIPTIISKEVTNNINENDVDLKTSINAKYNELFSPLANKLIKLKSKILKTK